MRAFLYSVFGFVIMLGVGWESWVLYKRREWRLSDQEKTAMQDSQRGRRPMWLPVEERKERER